MAEGDNDMCWICLEEAAENGSHQLISPCKCPRKVHPQCLARWQLQQAGRHEEKFCRFCNNELADWKHHLTPEELKPEVSKVQPIMVVYFEGQIHRIPVKQGPDGLDEFTSKIRQLFRLPEDVDISLTFGCKEPMSGSHLKLEGMGAFDAAVHCASVAAAERQQKIKKSYSTGNLGSSPSMQAPDGMTRSASINHVPNSSHSATAVSATSGSLSPATPPPAAVSSAAHRAAAQDRRQRFPAQEQPQQQHQHHAGNARSRSFSAFSSSGPRSTGVEPPAAFRNILGMLNGNGGSNNQQPQQQAAPGLAPTGRGSASSLPQASPRGGALPPRSPVNGTSAAEPAAAQPQQQQQVLQQQSSHRDRFKRERLSLRNISDLTDVPEVDETVAVGSLSGKFKLHLKAFSRKVARSLSFSNKSSGGATLGSIIPASGSSLSAGGSGGSVASMEDMPGFAAAGAAGGHAVDNSSFSFHSNSSSISPSPRVLSYNSPAANVTSLDAHLSPRGPHSPLPPTTPPSVYSC